MAKQKSGRKYGRNSRSNSSKLQSQRTAKNKRLAVERHTKRMAKKAVRKAERAEYARTHGGKTRAQVAYLKALEVARSTHQPHVEIGVA